MSSANLATAQQRDEDSAHKWVYVFNAQRTEGQAALKALLGGKGANLAEMSLLGLPVPPGFTITTEACVHYYQNLQQLPAGLVVQVMAALKEMENFLGKGFGDPENPLLVSVRSGARASMPGMMDTILNLGLNRATVQGIINKTGNQRFAYDSYRRFIQMYSGVVLGVEHHHFESLLDLAKLGKGVTLDTELEADDLQGVVDEYLKLVKRETGADFPQDVQLQLWAAINAVFKSWMNIWEYG